MSLPNICFFDKNNLFICEGVKKKITIIYFQISENMFRLFAVSLIVLASSAGLNGQRKVLPSILNK